MTRYVLLSKYSNSEKDELNFARKFEQSHRQSVKNFPNAKFLERGYLKNYSEYIDIFETSDDNIPAKISLKFLEDGAQKAIIWSESIVKDYISEKNFVVFH